MRSMGSTGAGRSLAGMLQLRDDRRLVAAGAIDHMALPHRFENVALPWPVGREFMDDAGWGCGKGGAGHQVFRTRPSGGLPQAGSAAK